MHADRDPLVADHEHTAIRAPVVTETKTAHRHLDGPFRAGRPDVAEDEQRHTLTGFEREERLFLLHPASEGSVPVGTAIFGDHRGPAPPGGTEGLRVDGPVLVVEHAGTSVDLEPQLLDVGGV